MSTIKQNDLAAIHRAKQARDDEKKRIRREKKALIKVNRQPKSLKDKKIVLQCELMRAITQPREDMPDCQHDKTQCSNMTGHNQNPLGGTKPRARGIKLSIWSATREARHRKLPVMLRVWLNHAKLTA